LIATGVEFGEKSLDGSFHSTLPTIIDGQSALGVNQLKIMELFVLLLN
jgi:hypothetical protein